MRLISWNVNGIRATLKRGDLDWFWDSDIDIFCLQEAKVALADRPDVLVEKAGWSSCWNAAEKKGYSGVTIFSRAEQAPTNWRTGAGDVEILNREGRILRAEYEEFILYNIYFPNGARDEERLKYKLNFHAEFLKVLQADLDDGHEVVLCGDINIAYQGIDLWNPKAMVNKSVFLPEERQFIDDLEEMGMIDTFRAENPRQKEQYTWWDQRTRARGRNEGWRIDYFFISEGLEEALVDAWISPQIMGSDHCPVGIELDL